MLNIFNNKCYSSSDIQVNSYNSKNKSLKLKNNYNLQHFAISNYKLKMHNLENKHNLNDTFIYDSGEHLETNDLDNSSIKHNTLNHSGATREWYNSIYSYNKNYSKNLVYNDNFIKYLFESYFNIKFLTNNVNNKYLRSHKFKFYRVNKYRGIIKKSNNKLLLSKPEIRHTNSKVIFTIFIYNNTNRIILKLLKNLYRKNYVKRYLRYLPAKIKDRILKGMELRKLKIYDNIYTRDIILNEYYDNNAKLLNNSIKNSSKFTSINKTIDNHLSKKRNIYLVNKLRKAKKLSLKFKYFLRYKFLRFIKKTLNNLLKFDAIIKNNTFFKPIVDSSIGLSVEPSENAKINKKFLSLVNSKIIMSNEHSTKVLNYYNDILINNLRKRYVKIILKKYIISRINKKFRQVNKYLANEIIINNKVYNESKNSNFYMDIMKKNFYYKRYRNQIRLIKMRKLRRVFKRLISCLYYNQIISFNKFKFTYFFLNYKGFGLINILSKVYNKKIEFNIVNLKSVRLNSDILTGVNAIKLSNRKADLLKVLKKSLSIVKIPNFETFFIDEPLNFEKRGFILNSIRHKVVSGIRFEASGRLTRRLIAARSVFKVKYKGTMKNIYSSYKKIPSVLLRGYAKSSVQYTLVNSKTANGSFGLKGWINSY